MPQYTTEQKYYGCCSAAVIVLAPDNNTEARGMRILYRARAVQGFGSLNIYVCNGEKGSRYDAPLTISIQSDMGHMYCDMIRQGGWIC
jgi:hypothetical protein